MHIKQLRSALLDLLFPRSCIGCRQSDNLLCQDCLSSIRMNTQQVCYLCRQGSDQGKTCSRHLKKNRHLDHLLIAAHYDSNPLLKKAIHTLKFRHHSEDIAKRLGRLLAHTLIQVPQEKLHVIPVPLHPLRQAQRGYNQALLLAHSITSIDHRQLTIDYRLMIRTRNTPPQSLCKTRQQRLSNLVHAFSLKHSPDPNATYLLIDDLTTTGSTLEECCEVLKKAGAREVWGLVLARN